MTAFFLGTNRFEDCEALIAHQGKPVLRIALDGGELRVDLSMPDGTGPLRIEANKLVEGEAAVVPAHGVFSVVVDQTLVLHALYLGNDEVLVDLDLRPLGAAIYTDGSGLHIGQSVLSGNDVQGARTAVALN